MPRVIEGSQDPRHLFGSHLPFVTSRRDVASALAKTYALPFYARLFTISDIVSFTWRLCQHVLRLPVDSIAFWGQFPFTGPPPVPLFAQNSFPRSIIAPIELNGEVEAFAKDDDDKTNMNTSQRRRKPKAEDATQQLSAAAIAAAASRKSANRSSRFGGLKGAIARSSLPVLVNVRSSFSDKLAASCRFNSRSSNSDEEETEPSSTTGDEVNRSHSPEK